MFSKGNRFRVIVIDPQKLRQAGLVRLLEGWAESHNLEIVASTSPEDKTVWRDCGMVVVNVGGASVLEDAPQLWIKSVRTFMSDVPVVILSDREDRVEIRAAFRAGVSGFIPTNLDPTLAIAALSFLSHGGSFFPCSVLLDESPSVREETARALRGEVGGRAAYRPEGHEVRRTQVRIATRQANWQTPAHRMPDDGVGMDACELNDGDDVAPTLTPRQCEVLERLSEGKSNKLIARDLEMTEATVKVHVRQIMRKFGASNRTQAALCAMRLASGGIAKRDS